VDGKALVLVRGRGAFEFANQTIMFPQLAFDALSNRSSLMKCIVIVSGVDLVDTADLAHPIEAIKPVIPHKRSPVL